MLRRIAALALLAATGLAQDEAQDTADGVVEEFPGFALEGRIARGERDAPAVFVRLADVGVVQVKVGDEWRDVTLRGLSDFLQKARDDDHKTQLAIGKSGLVDTGHGAKASRLFVSLAVGPAVPWQHVQWVVIMAMEQRYIHLELIEGKRSLLVLLPVDRSGRCGANPNERPPVVMKVSVHVVARKPQPATWGDTKIERPTEVLYRCKGTETPDVAQVTARLRQARAAFEEMKDRPAFFYGELEVGWFVPCGTAFEAMQAFADAEIPCLDTARTFLSIPSQEIRDAKRLPYPVTKPAHSHGAGD